jgi:hypothetical protein
VLHVARPAGKLFTVLLSSFEIGVAALVLSKGRRVHLALMAALAFMVGGWTGHVHCRVTAGRSGW